MSHLGHPEVETPYLDTLARNGITYTHAYSAVPSCIAARASLLTGLSQESHGRTVYKDGISWDYEQTLASGLAKAGYHTQCVGKMHVHPQRSLQGFHNVVLHDGFLHYSRSFNQPARDNQLMADDYIDWLKKNCGHSADILDTGLECNSWVCRPWMYEETYHPTNWTVSESIDFLRRRDPTKPFFLMTSFVRPHSPLDPPPFYFDMYDKKEIAAPYIGDWAEKPEGTPEIWATRGELSKDAYHRMRAGYYGCITHIDHQIGRLIQALGDYGVLYNTVILFVSDHGDLLGDHYLFRKSLPYEGSAHVPLMISTFGSHSDIRKNTVCNEVVELRDILPTVYDLASVPVEKPVDGANMLHADEGHWRQYLHGQHDYGELTNHYIVTKQDKYLYFPLQNREQYFRLDTDPHELHDEIHNPAYQDRIAELRSQLPPIPAAP